MSGPRSKFSPLAAKNTWKVLGPLTLEEIIEKTDINITKKIHSKDLELKSFDNLHMNCLRDETSYNGIGRWEVNSEIREGLFVNGKLNGYGRVIKCDGEIHIGAW